MDIVLRAAVAFLFIFVLTRAVGRRELSSLEPFDLILLVTIGDLIQQGVTQNDFSLTGLMLAVGTIAILTVMFSWAGWRFPRLRPVLEGTPVIIVQEGQPVLANLKRERLTVEEILAEARHEQIESLDKIKWAVLETSGKISFIEK
jgi:uncharacterized membrane protein YcaP (DUF421 family)